MAPDEFSGNASPLNEAGLEDASALIGSDAASIWTVISVETSGVGFLADKRPKILFERHIFSRQTGGKYDESNPDISNPSPGGYGASGAHQHERLQAAIALDREAALKSASWGLGQIMGFNYQSAGFQDVEEMVSGMKDSENSQLMAMMNFMNGNRLDVFLREKDWAGFARGYNGPNYAINQYDVKLASFYEKFSNGPLPDLQARAAQLYLTYLGYDPGPVDGMAGKNTLAALNQFLSKEGQPMASSITQGVLDLLMTRSNETA